MGIKLKSYWILLLVIIIVSCQEEKPQPKPTTDVPKEQVKQIIAPLFSEDSAYQYIEKQVSFGPRVPNSNAHQNCGDYLVNKLKGFGASVIEQKGVVTAFNGAKINIRNIIGQFQPEKEKRIMLFAHWDTRPFADRDVKDQAKPIDGANDGASGVGVLLEIGRILQQKETNVGVDVIFFDAEDYGSTQGAITGQQMADDWCLGTQYWANNPPIENYKPVYGILLDMVGASDAIFPKEYISMYFAPHVVDKVWGKAAQLGYGNYFVNIQLPARAAITDDHKYVNALAKIPAIDIIHYDPVKYDFGHFHHTHKDNMEVIDKKTLKAVGQTIAEVIYSES